MSGDALITWERRWIPFAGATPAITGLLVLLGWYLHQVALIQIAPLFAPMQRNTAFGLALCGCGLILCRGQAPWRTCGEFFGLTAGTVGLLTLIEYGFALDFGIDQLLGPGIVLTKVPFPGRMAPLSAVSFMLVSAAMVLGRDKAPSQWKTVSLALAATITGAIAVACLFSFILGATATFDWTQVTWMAPSTAACFLLLASAHILRAAVLTRAARPLLPTGAPTVAFWVPLCAFIGAGTILISLMQGALSGEFTEHGALPLFGFLGAIALTLTLTLLVPMDLKHKIASGVGMALAAMVLTGIFSYRTMRLSEASETWVSNARPVLNAIHAMLTDFSRAEAGYRGYMWTSDPEELQVWRRGVERTRLDLRELHTFTADNPLQQRNLQQAEACTNDTIAEIQSRIDFQQEHGGHSGLDAFGRARGWNTLEPVRMALTVMRNEEHRLLQEKIATAERNSQRTKVVVILGDGMALLFLAVATVVTIMAIRERRKTLDEIRRLNAELETRVAERTAELTASNHELEAFTYTAAHDLRAPLRHMHGFVNILRQDWYDKLDDDARGCLDKISASSRDMGALLDDLLNFSRLGRTALDSASVRLANLVERIRQELEPQSKGRTLTWEIGELPEVKGDPTLLYQALFNLISNAVKYTRKRENAHIEIGSTHESPDAITFFVRDNGAGFEMQYVDKLFRVFERLHSADDFEGTGIGLAIVRRVVERHGGRVWAESAAGQGATFYFSLPKGKQHGKARVHSAGGR